MALSYEEFKKEASNYVGPIFYIKVSRWTAGFIR